MQFDQLLDDRERWCYSIHNMNKMAEGEIPKRYGIFHKLYEDCRLTKLSTMEKQEYEKSGTPIAEVILITGLSNAEIDCLKGSR